jgi:hypothetical protein
MKFRQKEKLKIKNEVISEGFHWPNSKEIFCFFNHQISIFGFQFVSPKFRRMIKDFYSISGL